MTQTSIEWLINQLMDNGYGIPKEWREKAKDMHKQEVIDAWNGGDYAYFYSKETGRDFVDGSEYYQETFKQLKND